MQIKETLSEILYFIGSRLFLANVLKLVAAVALFVTITYWLLGCYTKHGDSVTVPTLKGMTIKQAEALLDSRDLNYTITDSVFDINAKPLQVMEQDPVANTKVKPSRYIYLTLNAVKPPMVKMPDLLAKSFELAEQNMQLRGLKIERKETRPDAATGTVLEMRYNNKIIKPGELLPKGAGVVLVVADGIGDTELDMPSLTCMTVDAAKFLIKSNNLNLGSIVCTGAVRDTGKAIVYKQNPGAKKGDKIRMGEQVDIYISATPPADCK